MLDEIKKAIEGYNGDLSVALTQYDESCMCITNNMGSGSRELYVNTGEYVILDNENQHVLGVYSKKFLENRYVEL